MPRGLKIEIELGDKGFVVRDEFWGKFRIYPFDDIETLKQHIAQTIDEHKMMNE